MEPAIPLTAEMARATGGSTGRTSPQCLPESPDEDAPQAVSDLPVQTTTAASARPQRERQAPAHLRSGDWLLHVNQWVDTTLPSPPPPPPYIGRYEFQTTPPGQPSTLPTPWIGAPSHGLPLVFTQKTSLCEARPRRSPRSRWCKCAQRRCNVPGLRRGQPDPGWSHLYTCMIVWSTLKHFTSMSMEVLASCKKSTSR